MGKFFFFFEKKKKKTKMKNKKLNKCFLGYFIFGEEGKQSILDTFPASNDVWINISRGAMAFCVVFSFPIVMKPLTKSFYQVARLFSET